MQISHVGLILLIIALYQSAVAWYFMRPRALQYPESRVFRHWKTLMFFNLFLLFISLFLFNFSGRV